MKFKIGEKIAFKDEDVKYGVIIDRLITFESRNGKPWCDVTYLVKPDGAKTFSEYKTLRRKDLHRIERDATSDSSEYWHQSVMPGGYTLLTYAKLYRNSPKLTYSGLKNSEYGISTCIYDDTIKSQLHISYAICSKDDKFDIKTGLKICRHRITEDPFVSYYSENENAFDEKFIRVILSIKETFIIEHMERFVNKRGKWFSL